MRPSNHRSSKRRALTDQDRQPDPVELEIFKALYTSVAEEMGVVLRRTAFSPNIKERRDYSCAVFDRHGRLIAQGDHMPVHLGSMPLSVKAALEAVALQPGDIVILNDPYAGGTHLPDVTMVSAVFGRERRATLRPSATQNRQRLSSSLRTAASLPAGSSAPVLFYVANRAHHSDIGGATPGSMGASSEIFQEGIRIPPVHIARGGQLEHDVLNLILQNVRLPDEREGDLTAQIGAMRVGQARLLEIVERYGFDTADFYADQLIAYTARLMRHTIANIPDGDYSAQDVLDDDGLTTQPIPIRVTISIRGDHATVDFTGSAPQVRGAVNAVEAITVSVVYYVFRCLIDTDVPASAGILEPIQIIAPAGTIVNARPPAPVAGGNVETSQRIADVLFKALSQAMPNKIPAASQGTMNNLSVGGVDHRTGKLFAYYETIAGGMGARPGRDGLHAIHTHMTNSLNTPTEALEYAYPFRVRRYAIRRHSGGRGRWRGGDGIVREIEYLTDARVSLLSDRRVSAPYGLHGGGDGKPGRAIHYHHRRARRLTGKFTIDVQAGDRIRIETPGGGGFGPA
ncbi:MAG: hydantoinase B/oxoprolinase family protein [Acidobacteriota bacterium]|nr:hydantoinase B/oxoprolinase family protein [Blastocatellia bacterium]MDW8240949.1 hydantoinase B/oxoprolinase family protein [Acidobacteriota bacterium]